MVRVTSILVATLLATSPVLAQPTQMRPPVPQQIDTSGWTLLGQQEVKGKRDKDTFNVGKYEGKFDQVQIVVLDSDVDVKEMTIHFANGEK